MGTKIRLGLIGCGGMGNNHVEGLKKIADDVKVTSVCDVVLERAQKFGELIGAEQITTDYKEMVDYVDAVIVSLPHDLHLECGMYFVKHNKHILMEKPLCNTEEECLRLIEATEKAKLTLMCAYPVRFYPLIVKMKEIADSKEYGDIVHMSIWTEQSTALFIEDHEWSATARLGGGQLFSHGCHYIDLMLWFMGKPVQGAHLGTTKGTYPLLKEGTSDVIMKFESGALGYHFGTWGARGIYMGYEYQIQFEKALVRLDAKKQEIQLYKDNIIADENGDTDQYTVLMKDVDEGKRTNLEILHFVDCIRTGKKPLIDGRTALESLRVIWKMYEAENRNEMADLRGLGF